MTVHCTPVPLSVLPDDMGHDPWPGHGWSWRVMTHDPCQKTRPETDLLCNCVCGFCAHICVLKLCHIGIRKPLCLTATCDFVHLTKNHGLMCSHRWSRDAEVHYVRGSLPRPLCWTRRRCRHRCNTVDQSTNRSIMCFKVKLFPSSPAKRRLRHRRLPFALDIQHSAIMGGAEYLQ